MDFEKLETEYAQAQFDNNFIHVTYGKVLTPEVTNSVYRWMGRVYGQLNHDASQVHGAIFDFSDIRKIDMENIVTAQQNSNNLNAEVAMSHIPVALVVKTQIQRDYVNLTTKITPQETRKKIVESVESAHAFIEAFHQAQNKLTPEQE